MTPSPLDEQRASCQHPRLFGVNWYQNGKMTRIKPLHCEDCGKTAKEMDAERNHGRNGE